MENQRLLNDISLVLPQQYPFIFIDKIIEFVPLKRVVAIKAVTTSDLFVQGHSPNAPVMPQSLMIESMSQASAYLLLKSAENRGKMLTVDTIKQFNFKRSAFPGDQLRIEVDISKTSHPFVELQGRILVDGQRVGEGTLTFSLVQRPSRPQIHPTATVHPTAVIGKDVFIGANSIIGEHVMIGDNTSIDANCFLEKWTKVGENCRICFGCVLGSEAQDAKYQGEKTWVVIGDNNILREYVTINRSTGNGTVTSIGSHNHFLTHVHVGHNCQIGDHVTIANTTNIAGHSEIHHHVTIGGMTGVHQFVRIGSGAMIGAYTRLPQDVPPFTLCEGNPALIRSLNLVGLKRSGITSEELKELKKIFTLFFRSKKNTSQAIQEIQALDFTFERSQDFVKFLNNPSKRGIIKKISAS